MTEILLFIVLLCIMYSVIDVANKIVANTNAEQGDIISNLKLQKLLYYLQGYTLAFYDRPLFEDDFEAWQYGPVVRSAYFHFNKFGAGAITLPEGTDIVNFPDALEEVFSQVMREYGQFSAIKLKDMTHDEMPWATVFNVNPQGIINKELLLNYFKTQIEE